MKVKVQEDRKVYCINTAGTQNENDATELEIVVPEQYQDFNKKIVFITDDGVVWDIIENNTYKLTNAITKHKSVKFYIWLTKDNQDFRSEEKTLIFNNNTNADKEITEEEINGINKLLNEIEELKDKINNIEVSGGGISESQIRQVVIDILVEYGLIQLESLTQEQIQALNEMECTIDENGELSVTYDETVLNLNFQVEERNLIIDNNINAIFNINPNGELEVNYE